MMLSSVHNHQQILMLTFGPDLFSLGIPLILEAFCSLFLSDFSCIICFLKICYFIVNKLKPAFPNTKYDNGISKREEFGHKEFDLPLTHFKVGHVLTILHTYLGPLGRIILGVEECLSLSLLDYPDDDWTLGSKSNLFI